MNLLAAGFVNLTSARPTGLMARLSHDRLLCFMMVIKHCLLKPHIKYTLRKNQFTFIHDTLQCLACYTLV